jgi:hypothetical protein
MKLHVKIISVLFVMAVSGCTKMEISSDYDPSVNFTAYATYQWISNTQEYQGTAHIKKEVFESRLFPIVEKELSTKKYTIDTTGKPDLLLRYHLTVKREVTVSDLRDTYYPATSESQSMRGQLVSRGGPGASNSFDKGTLILDFVDPKSKELVWRGTAAAKVHLYESDEEKKKTIAKAVKLIFQQFPPK